MFGYIAPDAPYLFKKDETLYKALYCGVCKGIGKSCGQCARTALTYDIAFLSALVHNIRRENVVIKKKRCYLHWFRRRPIAETDEITLALGCVNTALAYFKLCDDKADGDRRGVLRFLYKRGFKKAKKLHPTAVEIIAEETARQAELEKSGCASIDMACDPTAQLLMRLSKYLLGERSTEDSEWLFYDIGKWTYLADALDDYDKDVKKGRYNPIFNEIGGKTKCEMLEKGRQALTFVFDSLFADIRERLCKIEFRFNHDLTDNILLRGIPIKTRSLLNCGCKKGCKNEQTQS